MAIDRNDPFPNLPRSGGIARQYGVGRLARPVSPPAPDRAAAPAPQPAPLPEAGELEKIRVEHRLLQKQFAMLREDLAVLRSDLDEVMKRHATGVTGVTRDVTGDAGDAVTHVTGDADGDAGDAPETPHARRQRRYRERLRAKLKELDG